MEKIGVKIKKLDLRAMIPEYHSKGASGMDLHAWFETEGAVRILYPKQQTVIETKIAVAIPEGYEMQVRPRSGLAFKSGITVVNSPGTVDSDFRGEVRVVLYNLGKSPLEIHHGDRIAQAVVTPVLQAEFKEVEDLDATERGEDGYGSTGVEAKTGDGQITPEDKK